MPLQKSNEKIQTLNVDDQLDQQKDKKITETDWINSLKNLAEAPRLHINRIYRTIRFH